MDVKLDKMICNLCYPNELGQLTYFKQFNVYENIILNYKNTTIDKIDVTIPKLDIYTAKIIKTKIGTSLEGDYLSGKKLIITGNIKVKMILACSLNNNIKGTINKNKVVESSIPFATFIIIPNDVCSNEKINLRYLVEDVTSIPVEYNKVFISVTILMQYLDQY